MSTGNSVIDIYENLKRLEKEWEKDKISYPDYCSQNNGDCDNCSLANYNRDCKNNEI